MAAMFSAVLPDSRRDRLRLVATIAIVVLLVPAVTSAMGELTQPAAGATANASDRAEAQQVTFISEQGRLTRFGPHDGRVLAIQTRTKQVLWTHDRYFKYFDVDPLGRDRLLVTAAERTASDTRRRIAFVVNWRTNTELTKFTVPNDTHDIDVLGGGRYAIADKSEEGDRVYVYEPRHDAVRWEFAFDERFPSTSGGPPDDWTHLNDVDAVDNGTAFLVSPRNFDRVMLINRSTKRVEWALGKEDTYRILNEQHNPVLLDQSPPTVLVADSENDRVIEYRRTSDGWRATWTYSGDLLWPRDADRLPNGNTLIVDSGGDRVLEVTPNGTVVWAFETKRRPYDVERLQYGDEPRGPPLAVPPDRMTPAATPDRSAPVALFRQLYYYVGWVLPGWFDEFDFATVLGAGVVFGLWIGTESGYKLLSVIRDRRM